MEGRAGLGTDVFLQKLSPESPPRDVARIAIGGLIAALGLTALQVILQPFLPDTYHLARLFVPAAVTILLILIAIALLPIDAYPGVAPPPLKGSWFSNMHSWPNAPHF